MDNSSGQVQNTEYYTDEEYCRQTEIMQRKCAAERAAARKRVMRNRVIAVTVLIAAALVLAVSCGGKDEASETAAGAGANAADSSESAAETKDLAELEEQIENAVSGYDGEWSVYVKDLDTNAAVSINNRQVYAASIIKLYALAAAYQQILQGSADEEEIYDTLYEMIVNSSNESFNSVVRTVGREYITEWCEENGYSDTVQCHGLYPADNADGLETSAGYNLTTAEDTGRLLESIYRRSCISEEFSWKMLNILLDQTYRDKIPAGVPEGVKVANKTGETEDSCHDAAIIYSDGADYILVVLVDAPGIAYSCTKDVAKLSEIVYEYFNG